MNRDRINALIRTGEPVTEEFISALNAELPPVARDALDYTRYQTGRGKQLNVLMLEKDGVLGMTNFDVIGADKTNLHHLLYQAALSDLGVTSAAAVFEGTGRAGDPATGRPRPGAEPYDVIVMLWWIRGQGEGSAQFRVDSMGPQPRTLLMDEAWTTTQTRFSGLLSEVDMDSIAPESHDAFRKVRARIAHELRPLVEPAARPEGQRNTGP